ncbi:MAG: flavodoxin [Oscillospiraceae bacterium]|nr:flavodoxin [Oscillospiraceae bacterium]
MVLYFSGTGNSAFAAKRIAARLGDEVIDLTPRIKAGDLSPLESEKAWVIVSPTYAWQLPRIVRDHIDATALVGSREVYFVLTCGSGIGAAGEHLRPLAEKKGLTYKGCKKLVMPENYVAMFPVPDEAKSREIVRKALPVIDETADVISRGGIITEKLTAGSRLLSGFINNGFYRVALKDDKYTVSDACTGCMLCEKLCPKNYIGMKDGKPTWNGDCTQCMACICHCPAEAIEYGRHSVGKPRYVCPEEE